jgi:DNA-binding CsgD family transcriptional regulator
MTRSGHGTASTAPGDRSSVGSVAAPARPALPLRWTRTAQPALVGRQAELAALAETWTQVLRGCRQVVVVGGEPGVGKSRLVAEQCTALHGQGARVLVGTCVPDLGLPYQPFVEPVEALLDGPPVHASAGEHLRVVAGRNRGLTDPQEPEHRRQLYGSVVEALRELSRLEPLVLALEDLHWAGAPALELLTHLVERTPESRLLVLVTHRTTAPDRSAPLVGSLARLHRLDGVRRLDLHGLETEDVTEYLVREAGVPGHQARGPAAVLRDQTGGNPFFLRELWRDLSGRGGLSAVGPEQLAAPASIRDALQSRLLGLSEPQRQTLELAAAVGEEVDLPTLLSASAWSRDTTLLALDDGVAHGLLECVAPGRYRFPHALARQAVAELMPPTRRAHQHARVAEVLERRPAGSAGRAQALAHHYTQAQALGYGDKAVRYLVEAARAAEHALAHEDAARSFELAADLEADAPDALRLAAARSHLLGGDFARARALAEQVAASPGRAERLQAAVLYEAAAWRPGLPGHRAVELLTDGLATGPQDADDPLRVRALASLGRALAFTGDTEAARDVGSAALARARALGDDALLGHALQASLWHGLRPQDVPAKLARATELSALADRTGDLSQLGPAAYYRGVISYVQGDPTGWASAQADLVRMSQRTGQDFFAYMAGCLDYGRRFVTGDFAGAEQTCRALLDLGERFGSDGTEGPSAVQTFMLRRETGAVQQVRRLVTGEEKPTGYWAPGLLALYTELDLDGPAARLLRWVRGDQLAQHRESADWPAVLVFLVEAALHLQDAAAAEQLRPELAEYSGRNLVAGQFVALFGSADRYLGAVDSLLGDPAAEQELACALELDTRTGAPVHQAQTLAATVVHRRRVGADGADVDRLVRRTRAIAEPLGLVRPLRAVGRVPVPVPGQRPAGLTAREGEVLSLLVEGLSNREIAERLVVSEHTAANHVRSILAKTGSANRTQAAMYAAGHDLLR